jgi:hypothetical protein
MLRMIRYYPDAEALSINTSLINPAKIETLGIILMWCCKIDLEPIYCNQGLMMINTPLIAN